MPRSRAVRTGLLALVALALWGVTLEPDDPATPASRGRAGTAIVLTTSSESEAAALRSNLDRPLDRLNDGRPLKHRWPPLPSVLSAVAALVALAGRVVGRPCAVTATPHGGRLPAAPRGPPSFQLTL